MPNNWKRIEITPLDGATGRHGRIILRSCYWCGAAAETVVSRTSALSGNTYEDVACAQHSREWQAVKPELSDTRPQIMVHLTMG